MDNGQWIISNNALSQPAIFQFQLPVQLFGINLVQYISHQKITDLLSQIDNLTLY